MVALGSNILLSTAIFPQVACTTRARLRGRSVALYWKPGGHLKWKLAQSKCFSAIYWVRTWGLVVAGSKYRLNKTRTSPNLTGFSMSLSSWASTFTLIHEIYYDIRWCRRHHHRRRHGVLQIYCGLSHLKPWLWTWNLKSIAKFVAAVTLTAFPACFVVFLRDLATHASS